MPVVISMLRGVNLGNRRMKMETLRGMYEALKFEDVRTYVQSGNVIFRTDQRDENRLARQIEKAIENGFGFRSDVILRSGSEMREVLKENPFAERPGLDASKLLITFLAKDPGKAAWDEVRQIKTDPEEVAIRAKELYIYFPVGMGRSKLPMRSFERALQVPGTGRNLRSVTKMLEIAETMEG